MSTFFRKRPPYQPRHEQPTELAEDFPVVGPASEDMIDDDFPVLTPEDELWAYGEQDAEQYDEEDFPIVGPAAESAEESDYFDHVESNQAAHRPLVKASATAAPTATRKQFTSSSKIRLPEAPSWVQEQADSLSKHSNPSCDLPKTIPVQLENAIQVIINNEMEEAERRIKQKVLNELKNYFENL